MNNAANLTTDAIGQMLQKRDEMALELAKEITKVKALLDANKPLYDHLDQLTLQLRDLLGGTHEEVLIDAEQVVLNPGSTPIFIPPQYVRVNDNFAEKNTCFRTTAIKRFEAFTELVEERQQRLEKEAKKAAKAAAKG